MEGLGVMLPDAQNCGKLRSQSSHDWSALVKHAVFNLSGHELDYATVLANGGPPEGYTVRHVEDYWVLVPGAPRKPTFFICSDDVFVRMSMMGSQNRRLQPSADWSFAGKVIEAESLSLTPADGVESLQPSWAAFKVNDDFTSFNVFR